MNFDKKHGESTLIMAIKSGSKDIVKLLLDNNVETNVTDRFNLTPMDIAKKY